MPPALKLFTSSSSRCGSAADLNSPDTSLFHPPSYFWSPSSHLVVFLPLTALTSAEIAGRGLTAFLAHHQIKVTIGGQLYGLDACQIDLDETRDELAIQVPGNHFASIPSEEMFRWAQARNPEREVLVSGDGRILWQQMPKFSKENPT